MTRRRVSDMRVPYNSQFMRPALTMAVAIMAALVAAHGVHAAGPRTFAVEPEQSRAGIGVGKSGAFGFAGHTHEVEAPLTTGLVHLDPDDPMHGNVRLEFNAAAMRVSAMGPLPIELKTTIDLS